jgi:small conductance mechanosensitive channel
VTLWQRLFGHVPDLHVALPAMAIAIALALVFTQFIVTITRRLLVGPADSPTASIYRTAIRVALRLLAVGLTVAFTLVLLPPVLEMFGEPLRAGLRLSTLKGWLFNNGLRIVVVITLAYLLLSATSVVVARLEKYLGHARTAPSPELAKRARTLGDLVGNVFRAAVIGVAAIVVLGDLGVNTTPILTGAGILGLAVGFGAQTLVKDIISGFFLILENQVRVGDVAEINGTGGLVEAITLRTIVLRDARGAMHVFACGSVNTLANLTKDYAYALLDIVVHYRHDTDEVIKVLEQTAATLQKDPAFAPSILAPLETLGIENLGDTGVTIRVRMKTLPQRQWDVAREFRRRIKKSFKENEIEIPFATPTFPGRTAS